MRKQLKGQRGLVEKKMFWWGGKTGSMVPAIACHDHGFGLRLGLPT
jgi:hypothetical protein